MNADEALELLDWKRRIFWLYAELRTQKDPKAGWELWRRARDEMFAAHPQSPIPSDRRAAFDGLDLYDYDPDLRVIGKLVPASEEHYEIGTSGDSTMAFTRFAHVSFEVKGEGLELEVYWLDAYGGGIFLPFRDSTAGTTTYGAGRYLLDTVKGADLGTTDGGLVLDFNFAYNPSCSYDPRWVCPLAPPSNRLDIAIEAGEKHADR